MEPAGLSSQIRIQKVHEPGELQRVTDTQEEMVVIRKENECVNLNWRVSLGSGQDSDNDGVQLL